MRDAKYNGPATMASNILLTVDGATAYIQTSLRNPAGQRLMIAADTLEDAVTATVSLLGDVWGYERVTYVITQGRAVIRGTKGKLNGRIILTA